MARLNNLLDSFGGGMRRDQGRDEMPGNALWNLVDFIPDVMGAKLRKRGGVQDLSTDLSAIVGSSAEHVVAGLVAPFSTGATNIAFDEDGRAYSIGFTAGVASTGIGAVLTTLKPVFYNDKVIVPSANGTAAPQKITYNGSTFTVAALSGSPPNGRHAVIHKDVLWLAAPSTTATRIFFSVAGNPESWDLTNRWIDSSFPITGLAALSNAVFVFTLSRTMRVRGSIPPPDTDFIVDDPLFDIGCTDSRSIANYRDKVIWGNAEGLYISDGTAVEDLTALCGMKSWWLDVMAGYDGFQSVPYNLSLTRLVGQTFRDFYVYTIWHDSFGLIDAGMIDLKKYTWSRLELGSSGVAPAAAMWPQDYPEELYMGWRNRPYVGTFSSIFRPGDGNFQDANGSSLSPTVETPFFTLGEMENTLHSAYLAYDLRDITAGGGVNPSLTLSYIDSPEETTYTALSPTFPETSAKDRKPRGLNFAARGIGFKIAQTNDSRDTRIYALELESHQREGHR